VLKQVFAMPIHECWLHEPATKNKLARADEWMRNNPAQQSNSDDLEERLKIKS